MSYPFEPNLIVRASSLSEVFDCSARWKAKYLDGMTMPSGAAATIGTAVHRGTAVFDTCRMVGIEALTEEATEAARDSIQNPDREVHWDDYRPAQAIDIAARLTLNYCNDISPKFTYQAVEMRLDTFDVTASNGVIIRFTGGVDRKYVEGDKYGTLDLKTGKNVVKADGTVSVHQNAAQLGQYELLSLMATKTTQNPNILPAMIVAMPTGGKQTPKLVKVDAPHLLLIGNEQKKGLIDIVAEYYKHDLWVGNPRSMLCNSKYCPAFAKCHWRLEGYE